MPQFFSVIVKESKYPFLFNIQVRVSTLKCWFHFNMKDTEPKLMTHGDVQKCYHSKTYDNRNIHFLKNNKSKNVIVQAKKKRP